MERMITNLFDFQRFKQNARLGNIIQDVEDRYASTISDNDLEWVSAAGEESPQLYGSEYAETHLVWPVEPEETEP